MGQAAGRVSATRAAVHGVVRRREWNSMTQTQSDVLVSELAADPDLRDLVELFVQELPKRVVALQAALAKRDYLTMARLSHQLKGSAGGYGFPRISDAAKVLETIVKSRGSDADMEASLNQLADLCAKARATSD